MSDDAERAGLHRWAVKYKLEPRQPLVSGLSIWFEPDDGDWVKHEDAVAALREARAEEQLEVVHYLRNQGWPALAERIQNGAHKDYPRQSQGD